MPYTAIDPTTIPASLKATDQWVCWRYEHRDGEKPTKVPIQLATTAYASVSDPDTWGVFSDAYTAYRDTDDIAGIGYVFTGDDPFVGVDLDDCRDPGSGRLEEWARDIIHRLDSYTEASPSGTGVHVIVRGDLPAGTRRKENVELYARDRYFTVTGHHLDLTPSRVQDRYEAVAAVHAEYVAAPGHETDEEVADEPAAAASPHRRNGSTPGDASGFDDDDELLGYARNASNGDKFERLWRGDTAGYDSHSEADQALCNLLAFWTGGDRAQMKRLFDRSGLVREKWRDRPDYRERTIETAIRDCPGFYDSDR